MAVNQQKGLTLDRLELEEEVNDLGMELDCQQIRGSLVLTGRSGGFRKRVFAFLDRAEEDSTLIPQGEHKRFRKDEERHLEELPFEVLVSISEFLGVVSLFQLGGVSKTFRFVSRVALESQETFNFPRTSFAQALIIFQRLQSLPKIRWKEFKMNKGTARMWSTRRER
jgi:hypothetical protein